VCDLDLQENVSVNVLVRCFCGSHVSFVSYQDEPVLESYLDGSHGPPRGYKGGTTIDLGFEVESSMSSP
jgi:hypothetical protein